MKKIFKEYHNFSDKEFKKIWKECIFVFDTNTLLNMYRYSRKTVDTYFNVLKELKNKKQIWIPYQVGFEFYENRVNVISENEKSYDKILETLKKVKIDIESDYKDHPFLDIKEINTKITEGLSNAVKEITKAKRNHPKWLEKDDVLEQINNLFDGNIGENYNEEKTDEIKKEGIKRYNNDIPPGFKDKKKDESKKYGDLILWFQIIDKAKKTKKPIIFISGDVKEDWWLEKDGKKIMPLPKLKKEMYDKAGVDFHIYRPERFLELSDAKIEKETINEIRKIREIELNRNEQEEKRRNRDYFKNFTKIYNENKIDKDNLYDFQKTDFINGKILEKFDLNNFGESSEMKEGILVQHPKYGVGKILSLSGKIADIVFLNSGIKTMHIDIAQLTIK